MSVSSKSWFVCCLEHRPPIESLVSLSRLRHSKSRIDIAILLEEKRQQGSRHQYPRLPPLSHPLRQSRQHQCRFLRGVRTPRLSRRPSYTTTPPLFSFTLPHILTSCCRKLKEDWGHVTYDILKLESTPRFRRGDTTPRLSGRPGCWWRLPSRRIAMSIRLSVFAGEDFSDFFL